MLAGLLEISGNVKLYTQYGNQYDSFFKSSQNCHMIQVHLFWTYIQRTLYLTTERPVHPFLLHYSVYQGNGSNLDIFNSWILKIWYIDSKILFRLK